MSVDEDIQEIKKEIIQSHNLIIKTDNLVSNLASEIRQIQKKQESYERKYWINSVAAYVIIAALSFGGVYIGFDAKVGAIKSEKGQLEERLSKTKKDLAALQKKIATRAQQEKSVEHLLRLKREKRFDDALKVASKLDANRMSPVLGRLVSREAEELKQWIGASALDAGKSLLEKGYLKRALREFNRAVDVDPPASISAQAYYHRAELLLKLNKTAKAAEDFIAAQKADPKASFADLALFQAGGSLESSGDVPRALDAYNKLLKRYRQSKRASAARRRIARLTHKKIKPKPAGDSSAAANETPSKNKPAQDHKDKQQESKDTTSPKAATDTQKPE